MSERPQNRHLIPAKPGEVRNPNGRPKGSRNKLGEAFVAALHDDFKEHGKAAIEAVRAERPDAYLRVIAQVVPKELLVRDVSLEDMPDDELIELLDAVRSVTVGGGGAKAKRRISPPSGGEDTGSKPH